MVLLRFLLPVLCVVLISQHTSWANKLLAIESASSAKQLLVGLKHPFAVEKEVKRRFWAVADPSGGEYQKYLSRSELAELVEPSKRTVSVATAWLESLNEDKLGVRKPWFTVDMASLRATPSGDSLIVNVKTASETAPLVPLAVADAAVAYVVLLTPETDPPSSTTGTASRRPELKQPSKSKKPSKPKQDPGTSAQFGPAAQKAAYGVPKDLKGTNSKNSQMVFGTGTFGYRADDLKLFYDTYAPGSNIADVSLDKDNKWKGSTGKNFVEGMLDVSYITAMAPGVRTIVANTNNSAATESGEDFGAALLAFLVDLNGREEVPNVLSMSLGSLSFGSCDRACSALQAEGEHKYAQCWDYLQTQFQACMFSSAEIESRIDQEFAKLGLRGVTIVAASGDGGSHFAFGPFSGNLGSALNSVICDGLHLPVYPASSPYVLSVGGSEWQSDDMYGPTCSAAKPCGWESGGGGFSWDYEAPYQVNVTAAYLKLESRVAPKTAPDDDTFNGKGRGYPDVAALAQFGIPLCTYGGCSGSGGTSASAPTVAGMLSLINDARLTKGLKPLGFINSKLYKLMADEAVRAECFTDIGVDKVEDLWDCPTYSTCTGCDNGGKGPGFVATSGWDAQTGFGQPLFGGWMKHLGADSVGKVEDIVTV